MHYKLNFDHEKRLLFPQNTYLLYTNFRLSDCGLSRADSNRPCDYVYSWLQVIIIF